MAKKSKIYGLPENRGFKRDYPGINNQYTAQGKRIRREKALRISGTIFGFVFIFIVAYFVTSLMIDISNRPIIEKTEPETQQEQGNAVADEQTTAAMPQQTNMQMKAVWVNSLVFRSEQNEQSFIDAVKAKGINTVVIDFKRSDGTLSYNSTATEADKIGSNKSTVKDLSQRLEQLKESGLNVVARICCFKDPLAPKTIKTAAVHYKNTEGLWYNNYIDHGGEPWLNPYSQEAQQYLLSIIKEVNDMSVDGILLDYVQFPSGYALDQATFDGEGSGESRNKTLLSFIDLVKATIGREKTVIVSMTGDGALNGNSQFYDGTLIDSDAGVVSPDLRFSQLKAIKVGDTDFASPINQQLEFITLAGEQLVRRTTIGGRTKTVMPWIEVSEATTATLQEQLKALEDAGITSYILYNSSASYNY
ncbi:MAG: putative glycoside hydrolase [Clostridiales bacterium]|nr:putative glycoside hydrolase [Clostridiales bacterium]